MLPHHIRTPSRVIHMIIQPRAERSSHRSSSPASVGSCAYLGHSGAYPRSRGMQEHRKHRRTGKENILIVHKTHWSGDMTTGARLGERHHCRTRLGPCVPDEGAGPRCVRRRRQQWVGGHKTRESAMGKGSQRRGLWHKETAMIILLYGLQGRL